MEDGFAAINPNSIRWAGNVGVVDFNTGSGPVVLFYNKSVHNPAKSAAEGRPIYEDVVYVRIHPPGERLNIIDRPAEGDHTRRYPIQWAQFQQQKQQTPEGTPVDMLYPDHPSVGSMLRASGIYTIEQCAGLSGHAIESIGMGGQKYVNAAQQYIKMSSNGVKASEFRRELEQRDQEIKILKQKLDQQASQIEAMANGNVQQGLNLEQVQNLLAGLMQRPVHKPAGFDTATAQINAVHGSAQQLETVKPRRRRPSM